MTHRDASAVTPASAPRGAGPDAGRGALLREEVVRFGVPSTLVGIVTDPPAGAPALDPPGVLLLNAGLLHRIGPNRLYVELARRLAASGAVVLRFDFSGLGDSEVRQDKLPFDQSAVRETQAAMTFLAETRGVQRFVLMGLCSGAVNSFHAARADRRVVGTVMLDPWGYTAESRHLAAAHLYWRSVWRVLRTPRRWLASIPQNLKLGVMLRQLQWRLGPAVTTSALMAEFRALTDRGVEILVLFSSTGHRGARELDLIAGRHLKQLVASGRLTIENLGDATHTFESLAHQAQMLDTVVGWVRSTV